MYVIGSGLLKTSGLKDLLARKLGRKAGDTLGAALKKSDDALDRALAALDRGDHAAFNELSDDYIRSLKNVPSKRVSAKQIRADREKLDDIMRGLDSGRR